MLTPVNFLEEWKACENDMYKNLALLKVRLTNEAIHDMRVDIKKSRAYINLAEEIEKIKDDQDLIGQTQSLFDILGKHREWSLTLEVVTNLTAQDNALYPLFNAYIKRAKNGWAKSVKNALRTYDMKEMDDVGKWIVAIVHQRTSSQLAAECANIMRRSVASLRKLIPHFKSEIHNIRKLLKTILYWINLFPEEGLYNKKQVKKVNELLTKLGNWHDQQMVLRKIKNFRKDCLVPSFEEFGALKKLEDKVTMERDKIFSKLDPQKVVDALTWTD